MKHFILLFLIIASHSAIAQFDIVKKTEKLLLKEKYKNAIENIQKAVKKDSTNAAVYQAFASYYSYSIIPAYNIDSAHYYNLQAIDLYEKSDEKSLQKLNKYGIGLQSLEDFKMNVDSIAFHEANENPFINVFNHYIDIYSSSLYLDSAVSLRNQIAFDDARNTNTYQSYKSFMEKYPDAIQVEESKARFEKLYFEESVKDGKLDSYLKFLEDHPLTVYRSLVEQQILELSTLDNNLDSYLDFIQKFPTSKYSKTALDYAFHINNNISGNISNQKHYSDSLKIIESFSHQILFPYYNNGFGYINDVGNKIISNTYKSETIPLQECPVIFSDFIWSKSQGELVTKSGELFWNGDYDTIADLSIGLLLVSKNNKYGLIHKSGIEVLPMIYEEIKVINNQFLGIKIDGLWGLSSTLGRLVIAPEYQSATNIGDFILFQKLDQWAVTNSSSISQTLETSLELSFDYDEFEFFDDHYLMVYRGDNVNLVSKNLDVILPNSTMDISISDSVLIIQDMNGYSVLNATTFDQVASSVQPILSNETGTYYKREQAWYTLREEKSILLNCDSLQLINDHFVKYYYEDSIGFNGVNVEKFHENIQYSYIKSEDSQFILINKSDSLILVNIEGELIDLGLYDKIWPVTHDLLIAEKNSQKGLISLKNKALLDFSFDAIQQNKEGTFTLLQESKFGVYSSDDNTLISPEYESRLSKYNDSLYVAKSENMYGLINHNSTTVLPFEFDQILYWNDTSALVKKGYQWIIYDIYHNQIVIDKINQYDLIDKVDDVQIMKIYKDNGYGIIHSTQGELIPPSFYNILKLTQQNTTIYVAEKYIEEADFYVLIYYNSKGETIFKHAMESEYYQNIKCEIP